MKVQKGFTLIELMVVIVIIGILSALAIPKMFGVSAKAKAAEAPGVIANYETLTSAYAQETGMAAMADSIGFKTPTGSKWFTYADAVSGSITATVSATMAFGDCTSGQFWGSGAYNVTSDAYVAADGVTSTHIRPTVGGCAAYTPNF